MYFSSKCKRRGFVDDDALISKCQWVRRITGVTVVASLFFGDAATRTVQRAVSLLMLARTCAADGGSTEAIVARQWRLDARSD